MRKRLPNRKVNRRGSWKERERDRHRERKRSRASGIASAGRAGAGIRRFWGTFIKRHTRLGVSASRPPHSARPRLVCEDMRFGSLGILAVFAVDAPLSCLSSWVLNVAGSRGRLLSFLDCPRQSPSVFFSAGKSKAWGGQPGTSFQKTDPRVCLKARAKVRVRSPLWSQCLFSVRSLFPACVSEPGGVVAAYPALHAHTLADRDSPAAELSVTWITPFLGRGLGDSLLRTEALSPDSP